MCFKISVHVLSTPSCLLHQLIIIYDDNMDICTVHKLETTYNKLCSLLQSITVEDISLQSLGN